MKSIKTNASLAIVDFIGEILISKTYVVGHIQLFNSQIWTTTGIPFIFLTESCDVSLRYMNLTYTPFRDITIHFMLYQRYKITSNL